MVSEVKDNTPYDATNTVSPLEKLDGQHMLNFCETIRGNEKVNAPILEGHKSTLLPQLGNIALRVGRTLNCDPATGRILDDPEAMKLWSRDYEKGVGTSCIMFSMQATIIVRQLHFSSSCVPGHYHAL